jgi:hypothetical protein
MADSLNAAQGFVSKHFLFSLLGAFLPITK